jgi:hypothetical protein
MTDITLTDTIITLTLPGDLIWEDQHSWSPMRQSTETTLTGALIVDVSELQAGRPITLSGDHAWITGATLAQLKTWRDTLGQTLTLTRAGVGYTVIFRHEDTALEAEKIETAADNDDPADHYTITLRLTEI